jgi:uncharacterized membrane protein
MSEDNISKKSWYKRRWIRILILIIIIVILVQLEQNPSSNPFGANVVILNAIVGIWLWVEIIVGIISGVIWLIKKLRNKVSS